MVRWRTAWVDDGKRRSEGMVVTEGEIEGTCGDGEQRG